MSESTVSEFFGFRSDCIFWPVILALLSLIMLNPMHINKDCMIYLEMGKMLVQGKLPYVDFGEVNPPLIIYLSAIPALMAKLLPLNIILIFLLLVWGLVVWSTLFMRRLFLRSGLAIPRADVSMFLLFWSLFSVWVYYQNDFGQRDYLFMMLFIPFFVARWIRCQDGEISFSLAVGAGFAGAVGVCVKPHFIVVALACEAYWIVSYRQLSKLFQAETLVLGITGCCYAIHFMLLPGIVKTSIFHRWLPFVMAKYHAYDSPLTTLLRGKTFWPAFIVGLLPVAITSSRKEGLWRMAPSLSVLAFGCLLVYLWQHKGFSYHTAPYIGAAMLILGAAAAEAFAFADQPQNGKSFRFKATIGAGFLIVFSCAALLVAAAGFRTGSWGFNSRVDTPFSKIIAENSLPGDRILTVTSSLDMDGPLYTTLLMERKPAHRWFFTFWMGMLYAGVEADEKGQFPYHSRSEAPEEEIRLIHELEEDISKFNPKLIFVLNHQGCQGCPQHFSIMEYSKKIGLMNEIGKRYRLLTNESGYSVFILNSPSRKIKKSG
ncbi:MAG: hypothetical protein ACLP5H_10220 [Desulfomonilaceae bacterium]